MNIVQLAIPLILNQSFNYIALLSICVEHIKNMSIIMILFNKIISMYAFEMILFM